MFSTKRTTYTQSATYDMGLREYMLSIYRYMFIALAITGFTAFFVASSASMVRLIYGTPLSFVLAIAPIGFVYYMNAKMMSIGLDKLKKCLWIFSVVMGLSLSSIFLMFKIGSIAKIFFITASSFGAMSIYGYTTKKDLTAMGSFMIMGVIGIVIASLVNIFLRSSALHFALSFISVIIFTALTAYDVQKLKNAYNEAYTYNSSGGALQDSLQAKVAVMGALTLYFDFINVFLSLLQLFGDRRDS